MKLYRVTINGEGVFQALLDMHKLINLDGGYDDYKAQLYEVLRDAKYELFKLNPPSSHRINARYAFTRKGSLKYSHAINTIAKVLTEVGHSVEVGVYDSKDHTVYPVSTCYGLDLEQVQIAL